MKPPAERLENGRSVTNKRTEHRSLLTGRSPPRSGRFAIKTLERRRCDDKQGRHMLDDLDTDEQSRKTRWRRSCMRDDDKRSVDKDDMMSGMGWDGTVLDDV